MREFLRDNPHFKVSIIITVSAIVPMLYLAVVGIIRGKYPATAICAATTVILASLDVIMIGRRYKQYKRGKAIDATFDAVNKYLDGLIDESKNNKEKGNETMDEYKGLKAPKMGTEELEKLWREVKNNRGYVCPKGCEFCGNLDCNECVWSCQNSAERYDYLKSIFEKEDGDKETMDENKTIEEFLRPGVLFKTENGHWYINIRGNYAYNVMTQDFGDYIKICSCSRVNPNAIIEAYDIDETISREVQPLFLSNIEAIIKGRPFTFDVKIWKRPEPVKEMTMSDLEKHFGCKVKIVKDN